MGVKTFYANFRRRIGSLLEGGFTDAILVVEGVEIPVHRCILAAHSEYFCHLFSPNNDPRETAYQRSVASDSQSIVECEKDFHSNQQSLVEINDVTVPLPDNVFVLENTRVKVVRAVLNYFYRGEYNYDDHVETHLLALELAHQFGLRDLEETLIKNLVTEICLENFVDFYNMNMQYKNVQLEESCLSFLKENGEEIAMSDNFSKLTRRSLLSLLDADCFSADEMVIFRASERWATVNKPDKKTVKVIIEKIRLATISQADLFDVVRHSKEFPSIDILEPIQSIVKKDAASTNFRQQPPTFEPVANQNMAKSNLGAQVLSGNVTGADLISDSSGCTSHKVGGKPDSIVVKLNKTYRLNALQVSLDSSEGRSYKYHVEVSVNGVEWERVVDHSCYWCRSHQHLRFDSRAVKFIKMTGTDEDLKIISLRATYTNKNCSLVQGLPVASTNVALASRGATVTGYSSRYYTAMYCIDGKKDSCALVTKDSPLIIRLGQPYWLSSLRVKLIAGGTSYTIESSLDGESWLTLGEETEGMRSTVCRTFEFSRRVVLQFRVTMDQKHPHCSPASKSQ